MIKANKRNVIIVAVIAIAMIVASILMYSAKAAWTPTKHTPNVASTPGEWIRLPQSYASGLVFDDNVSKITSITTSSYASEIKTETEAWKVFKEFDREYNAQYAVKYSIDPGSSSLPKTGFYTGSDPFISGGKDQVKDIVDHVKETERNRSKWYMFKLHKDSNQPGDVKVVLDDVLYYDSSTRRGEPEKIRVVMEFSWTGADFEKNIKSGVPAFLAAGENMVSKAWPGLDTTNPTSQNTVKSNVNSAIYKDYDKIGDENSHWTISSGTGGDRYQYERKTGETHPYMILSITDGALAGIRTARLTDVQYSVKFYKTNSNEAKRIDTSVMGSDVDAGQRVMMSSQSTNNVPAYIVDKNTNFLDTYNAPMFEPGNNRFVFQDGKTPYAQREDNLKDSFAVYLQGTTGYTANFRSGHEGNGGYSYFAQSSAGGLNYYEHPEPVKTVGDHNENENENNPADRQTSSSGILSKSKSDIRSSGDRTVSKLQDTVVSNYDGTVTFKVRHRPQTDLTEDTMYTDYIFRDTIHPAFEVISADMSGPGSSYFEVKDGKNNYSSTSGTPVTATLKSEYTKGGTKVDNGIKKIPGYEHVLVIKCKLRNCNSMDDLKYYYGKSYTYDGKTQPYLNNEQSYVIVPNVASVNIKDDGPAAGGWNDKTMKTDTTYTCYEVPKPKKRPVNKYVSDTDTRKVLDGNGAETFDYSKADNLTENAINSGSNQNPSSYTYHITNTISDGYTDYWKFNKYEITDTVQPLVKIDKNSFKVWSVTWADGTAGNYTNKTDVTSWFTASFAADGSGRPDRKITINATSSALNSDAFYAHKRYIFEFKASIDYENYHTWAALKPWDAKTQGFKDVPLYRFLGWKNTASLHIEDREWDGYTSEANIPHNKPVWNDTTNETRTYTELPKPDKNVPYKRVSDTDGKTLVGEGAETRLLENTLRKPDDIYTYHIRQKLGGGGNSVWTEGAYSPYWKFKKFVISDTFKNADGSESAPIKIVPGSAHVYQYTWSKADSDPGSTAITGGTNVDNLFTVSIASDGKTVTATMKPDAFNVNAEDLTNYNIKLYELRFDCQIDFDKYFSESELKKWEANKSGIPGYDANNKLATNVRLRWPNKAKVDIEDNNDPWYPNTENGKNTWSKETNTVNTNVWVGVPDKNELNEEYSTKPPGIEITKTADPYEFQVDENIPYTITLEQLNKDAVSYKVLAKDIDFPSGFTVEDSTFSVELKNRNAHRTGEFKYNIRKIAKSDTAADKGEGFQFETDYLYHGEKIVIKFNGKCDKTLNGKVVPNTVMARTWAAHDKNNPETAPKWDRAKTSVYINSPDIRVTKTTDKNDGDNSDGNASHDTGEGVLFTTTIKNNNPGTIMRNIYAVDTSETKGLRFIPGSVKVYIKRGETAGENDWKELKQLNEVTLKPQFAVSEFSEKDSAIYIDGLSDDAAFDNRLGSQFMKTYDMKTHTKAQNDAIESAKGKNTGRGEVLPTSKNSGFVVKLLGKYRNLGDLTRSIPPENDNVYDKIRKKEGKDSSYMKGTVMETVEKEQQRWGGAEYVKDYVRNQLNLQNEIKITYRMKVDDNVLAGKDVTNFVRVPSTENTNNDLIWNNDDIRIQGTTPTKRSGGNYARHSFIPGIDGDVEKKVEQTRADKGTRLDYTIKCSNVGPNMIVTPIITDKLVTENFEANADSFKVYRNSVSDANEIVKGTGTDGKHYQIKLNNAKYEFEITIPNMNMKKGEVIIVKYNGQVTKNIKESAETDSLEELEKETIDTDGPHHCVHNKAMFMGKEAHVRTPNIPKETPVKPEIQKDVQETETSVGSILNYTVKGGNAADAQTELRNVVFTDVVRTKNFEYDPSSFRIYHVTGENETDITDKMRGNTDTDTKDKLDLSKPNTYVLSTGMNLKKNEYIVIKYSGKVLKSDDETVENVHNVVEMTGDNFEPISDFEKVPFGDYTIDKNTPSASTEKGKKHDFTIDFTNLDDEAWEDVVLHDEILTKNAEYNKDFKIMFAGKDITDECKFEYNDEDYSVTIKTGKQLNRSERIFVTYSVTALDDDWLDNHFEVKTRNKSASDKETIPPVTHEKEVESFSHDGEYIGDYRDNSGMTHDGPDGLRNVINYKVETKHNGTKRDITGVVIRDDVLSENAEYTGEVKVKLNDKDLVEGEDGDYTIKYSEDKMHFTIKLKDEFKPGDKIITRYSVKVKDKKDVHNETTFTADDVDEITDDEIVPPPVPGKRFVMAYKDCDPPSGTKVEAGQEITYKITVKNTGTDTAPFVHVRDYIPKGTTFTSVQDSGVYNKDKNYCDWVIKDLKPGDNNAKTVSFKVKVNTENTPKIILNNALYEDFDKNPGEPGKITVDPKTPTNEVMHYTGDTPPPYVLLSGEKTSEPESGTKVNVGDEIKYIITLTNKGNADTDNAGIRDYIPEGTEFVSAENGGKYNAEKKCVDWTGLSVAKNGGKISVSFKVKVLESVKTKAKDPNKVINYALYQDKWLDQNFDPSSETNKVIHPLDDWIITGEQVTVYKDCDPPNNSLVKTGDIITYKLIAKNTGEKTSRYTRIRDYIPKGVMFHSVADNGVFVQKDNYVEWIIDSIPVNETKQVSFKVTVNVDPPKLIKNHALFKTTPEKPGNPGEVPGDPEHKTNEVQHKTDKDIQTDPIIEVIKDSIPKPGTPVVKGDIITYTLDTKNSGEKTAKSIVVRDKIPEGTEYVENSANLGGTFSKDLNRVQWVIPSLDGGKNTVLEFKVKVTADKFDLIQNQARYDMDFDPEDPEEPKNSSNIVEHPPVPMKHTKTADKKRTYEGAKIKYTLTTKVLSDVKQVVITDKVTSKNFEYNKKSLKVFYNTKNVTKKMKKITFKKNSFKIVTGMDAKEGDVFKVKYSGKALNGKKVVNESTAYAEKVKPIKAKKKIPPEPKPNKPMKHKKTAKEKTTRKGKTIHYTLTTNVLARVQQVVITDRIQSKNFEYNKKSFKVFFNGKNVTKKMKKITVKKNSFKIVTGMNAKKGDVFKVKYSGKALNGKRILNVSAASAKKVKPIKAKHKIPSVKKPDKAMTHVKSSKEKTTRRGKTIHYTLTTKILTRVEKVVITDKIQTKNFAYNPNSIRVFKNGKNVTKRVKSIVVNKWSFTIKTGMNAKKGDVFKVRYNGKALNGKRIINLSAASAKGFKPVKDKYKIPSKEREYNPPSPSPTPTPSNPSGPVAPKVVSRHISQTGDHDFVTAVVLFGIAAAGFVVSRRFARRRKDEE